MLGRVTISFFCIVNFFHFFKMDPDYTYQTVPCPATRYGESRFRDENGICVRESELLGRYPDNQDEKSALHQLHGHTTSLLSQLDFYVEDLGMITIAIFYNLLLLFKCCFLFVLGKYLLVSSVLFFLLFVLCIPCCFGERFGHSRKKLLLLIFLKQFLFRTLCLNGKKRSCWYKELP